MGATKTENWRTGISQSEKKKVMFEKQYGSNVVFHVGSSSSSRRVMTAHSYVLVLASPVLESLVNQSAADNTPIIVDNVDPGIFYEMLRCLYCDTANVTSGNVIQLLNVAGKFQTPALIDVCTQFLDNNVDVSIVCRILNTALDINAEQLTTKCLDLINTKATHIMRCDDFVKLSHDALMKVLTSNKLEAISEVDVYRASMRWADEECRKNDRALTDQNRREVLGEGFYQIRFPLMTNNHFAELTSSSSLLSPVERSSIHDLIAFGAQTNSQVPLDVSKFNATPRKYLSEKSFCRYFTVTNDEYLCGKFTSDAIDVHCDKDIAIYGVGLYVPTQSGTSAEVNISLIDASGHKMADTGDVKLQSRDDQETVKVSFSFPVLLLANNKCSVVFSRCSDLVTHCGSVGCAHLDQDDCTFTFTQSTYSSPGCTTVSRGQIPVIFFSKL